MEPPNTPQLPTKKIAVIGVAALLLIALLVFVVHFIRSDKAKKITYRATDSFGSNIKDPLLLSKNDVRFFNGRNFISFDPVANQTTKLLPTDIYTLASLKDFRWSSDGNKVAFKAGPQSPNSYLGKILTQNKLDLSQTSWWYISLRGDQIFHPINKQLREVFWHRDELVTIPDTSAYDPDDAATVGSNLSINAVSTQDGSSRELFKISVDEIKALGKIYDTRTDDLYYTRFKDNKYILYRRDKAGSENQILTNGASDILVSGDGTQAAYFILNKKVERDDPATANTGTFYLQSTQNKSKAHKVTHDNVARNIASFTKDSKFLVTLEKPSENKSQKEVDLTVFRQYGVEDNAAKLISPSLKIPPNKVIALTSLDNGFTAFTTEDGIRYLSKDEIKVTNPPVSVPSGDPGGKDGYLLIQYKDKRVMISILTPPLEATMNKVNAYIKSKGVNPDMLVFIIDTTNIE